MYGDDVRDLESFQLSVILGVAIVAHIKSRQDLRRNGGKKPDVSGIRLWLLLVYLSHVPVHFGAIR